MTVPAQFEACYRKHWSRVFRWSLRYAGGNATWAEDLAHDVFLRLLERFGELERHGDIGGWLYRTTANLAIDRLRREKSWMTRFSTAWRVLQGDAAPSPEIVVLERQDAARALATLNELPPKERIVVTMKLLDGKAQRDIADVLGMSEGYVSKLLKRGLERVRSAGWEVKHG